MERPNGRIEQPQDEYDFEITQTQADAIVLADELLKHKPEGSPLTFVDIVLVGSCDEMQAEIERGPFANLLAEPDEQLALWSDGNYYPILDVRKQNGRLCGVGLRVWGWDNDKYRYTKPREEGAPYEYKEYPGQKDKDRQLELAMSYVVGEETVTETLSLWFGTSGSGNMRASTQLHMMAYVESGYEGHGGKGRGNLSDEEVYWLLDFVARYVGNDPKSVGELQDEMIEDIRILAGQYGVLKQVDKLITATWNAQALYLMGQPCKMLDGVSIAQSLKSPETAVKAGEAARILSKQWKARIHGTLKAEEWILGREKQEEARVVQ